MKHKAKNKISGSRARLSTAAVAVGAPGAIENERDMGGGDDPNIFVAARYPSAIYSCTTQVGCGTWIRVRAHLPVHAHKYGPATIRTCTGSPSRLYLRPIRIRLSMRPRSYQDMLDDFAMHDLGSPNGEKSDSGSNAGSCPMNASASTIISGMPRPRHIPKTSPTEEDAQEKTIYVVCCKVSDNARICACDWGYQNTAGDRAGSAGVGDGVRVVGRGERYVRGGGLLARRKDSSAVGMLNDIFMKGVSTPKLSSDQVLLCYELLGTDLSRT
ncbi:hypothetical protein EV401DRAFT_1888972 [Pisolithus croceorrhizus]|nr:hypothetical protein EV401DRAFT_1888972 [Pisolithus croceorrhizus]